MAYRLTSWTGLFNRIHAMRLVSAFLGALTVLFVFLFLRELLPRVPWAWSMGSLAVAFVPLFGEISGTVKEDNLAFAPPPGCCFLSPLLQARPHRPAWSCDRRLRRSWAPSAGWPCSASCRASGWRSA